MRKLSRYIPKELSQSAGKIKLIVPPKGRISSKAAYRLERSISVQLTSNESESLKSLAYAKRNEYQ